jgi:hypothetical protein
MPHLDVRVDPFSGRGRSSENQAAGRAEKLRPACRLPARIRPRIPVVRLLLFVACAFGPALPLYAQAPPADPVRVFLNRVEQVLNADERTAFPPLFAPSVTESKIQQYANDLFTPRAIRKVVLERGRAPLEGAPPGDGYSLVVEFFVETPGKARILTSSIDIRRPPGGDLGSWRVVAAEGLSSVEGLYRLRLNTTAALGARDLEITSEDLVIVLHEGTVFLVECDDGVTGMVLLGRGEVRFSPSSAPERVQVRIFSGSDTLAAPFESAFVRISPSDYQERVSVARLTPATPEPRLVRRAQDVFNRESPRSFSVDLQDMSRDTWHLLPPSEDFLAEVETRRFDTLTFSRSSIQAEDVSLYRREDRRTIALYPSVAKLAARGRFYSDDAARDYDVLDYNVEASIDPARQTISGRARLAIRVRSTSISTLLLRLAEQLTVTGITSVEYGRLLHFRLRSQNTILVNVPRSMLQDSDLTLVITYAGRLPAQDLDADTIQVAPEGAQQGDLGDVEGNYLLSNRSYWYPQNPIPDYATATLRISVPKGYAAVASGEPVPAGSVVAQRDVAQTDENVFAFRASQALRYLAVIVSRFTRVAESTIEFAEEPNDAASDRVAVAIDTNPRQQARGRALLRPTEDILRFYASIIGDAPYASATVALVESQLPGGHSPGYFAVLNQPLAPGNQTWRGDPAAFDGFPDFFLAHELAHQWWGQAIGWKNYHEQWLSEGFAQYFAALYAQKTRGDRVFIDMLRQFRRWSLSESDQGPVYLGYRLGHIKGDQRVFRALVYNKGAAVLHMLRRLLGDQVFFNGLRRFYVDRRYQKAGTDDFERAMEAESGRVLDRFFERWIYGTELPRVSYASTIREREVVVRFEQTGDIVFDLPVTVTLVYADGRTTDVAVPVTEKQVERTIPTAGIVRQVQVNRDSAALAEFEQQ